VPDAQANLSPVPDEQILLCLDIMSTGFAGDEAGGIKIGDTVVVFAQGATGLCATAGARLRGAGMIIATGRLDLGPMVTHRFALENIVDAYDLFSHQRDGVLKVSLEVSEVQR
tara:strand:+ start:10066 stop:10404 length:339 start_codon:yes stop_codon:yes gene_type:complete